MLPIQNTIFERRLGAIRAFGRRSGTIDARTGAVDGPITQIDRESDAEALSNTPVTGVRALPVTVLRP